MDPHVVDQINFWNSLAPSPVPHRMTGLRLLREDTRDANYPLSRDPGVAMQLAVGTPEAASLEEFTDPNFVYQQGNVPRCVASSQAGAQTAYEKREQQRGIWFDDAALYAANGGTGSSGVDTRRVLGYCQAEGILVLNDTKRFKIGEYLWAPQVVSQFRDVIKAAIASGKFVVLALLLPQNFGWDSSGSPTQGYHQVYIYAYDAEWVYFVNSWGPGWSRQGKGRVRWEYLEQNGFLQGFNYAYAFSDAKNVNGSTNGGTVTDPTGFAAEVLALLNRERSAAGLQALKLLPSLVTAAQNFSRWMADNNKYGHSADGRQPIERMLAAGLPANGWSHWGENIAAGQPTPGSGYAPEREFLSSAMQDGVLLHIPEHVEGSALTPGSVHGAWMGSPGHRANLLFPAFTHVGIGFTQKIGTAYGTYWVQNFVALRGDVSPPPPPPPPPPVEVKITRLEGQRVEGPTPESFLVGTKLLVHGEGFTSSVVSATIGPIQIPARRVSPAALELSLPSVSVVGVLRVRVEGVEVNGPQVAVVLGGGPPPPDPLPSELTLILYTKRLFRSRLGVWVVVKRGGSNVGAAVTVWVNGTKGLTNFAQPNGTPATFLITADPGTPLRFEAENADGKGTVEIGAPRVGEEQEPPEDPPFDLLPGF